MYVEGILSLDCSEGLSWDLSRDLFRDLFGDLFADVWGSIWGAVWIYFYISLIQVNISTIHSDITRLQFFPLIYMM